MMKRIFGESWKTTLMGIGAGLSIILQDYVDKEVIDWKRILFAFFVFLIGYFSKDHKSDVK